MLAFCGEIGVLIYKEEYVGALTIASSAFVGFALVSLMRRLIDAPRPYELYSFYERKPKEKSGSSFPSRHVYSAFAITTLAFFAGTLVAILLLLFALIMSLCRILLGIHFIRDVAAGALIGIIAGVIGLILL